MRIFFPSIFRESGNNPGVEGGESAGSCVGPGEGGLAGAEVQEEALGSCLGFRRAESKEHG